MYIYKLSLFILHEYKEIIDMSNIGLSLKI